MILNDNLNAVLHGIFAGVADENRQRLEEVASNPGVMAAAACLREDDLEGFHFALNYPLGEVVDGLLEREFPGLSDVHFLFKQYAFVENHFLRVIEQREGTPLSCDKCSTVLSSLLAHLKTGAPIAFNFDQTCTYYLPQVVFRTQAEIVDFFHAVHHLYYGKVEPYLVAWQALLRTGAPKQGD